MSKAPKAPIANPKIAVIGPTQSGKTCLALGLYATSLPSFTVEPNTLESANYLAQRRAEMATGRWADATNKETKQIIDLRFQRKGKDPVCVYFYDFAGEKLRNEEEFRNFANAHFKNLDGVVILINPGSESFNGDVENIEDMHKQYKLAIKWLKENSPDAYVALTVTASDRISRGGDMRDRLPRINEFVEELMNTLATSGFKHRLFNVSITGHLANQEEPKLAKGRQNSSSKPFLWLLEELNWRPRRAVLHKVLIAASVLSFAAIIVVVALCRKDPTALDNWASQYCSQNRIDKHKIFRDANNFLSKEEQNDPDGQESLRASLVKKVSDACDVWIDNMAKELKDKKPFPSSNQNYKEEHNGLFNKLKNFYTLCTAISDARKNNLIREDCFAYCFAKLCEEKEVFPPGALMESFRLKFVVDKIIGYIEYPKDNFPSGFEGVDFECVSVGEKNESRAVGKLCRISKDKNKNEVTIFDGNSYKNENGNDLYIYVYPFKWTGLKVKCTEPNNDFRTPSPKSIDLDTIPIAPQQSSKSHKIYCKKVNWEFKRFNTYKPTYKCTVWGHYEGDGFIDLLNEAKEKCKGVKK